MADRQALRKSNAFSFIRALKAAASRSRRMKAEGQKGGRILSICARSDARPRAHEQRSDDRRILFGGFGREA